MLTAQKGRALAERIIHAPFKTKVDNMSSLKKTAKLRAERMPKIVNETRAFLKYLSELPGNPLDIGEAWKLESVLNTYCEATGFGLRLLLDFDKETKAVIVIGSTMKDQLAWEALVQVAGNGKDLLVEC